MFIFLLTITIFDALLGLVVIGVLIFMTISEERKEEDTEKKLEGLSADERAEEEAKEAKKEEKSLALPLVKVTFAFLTFNTGVTELGVTLPDMLKKYFAFTSSAVNSVSTLPNFAYIVLKSSR